MTYGLAGSEGFSLLLGGDGNASEVRNYLLGVLGLTRTRLSAVWGEQKWCECNPSLVKMQSTQLRSLRKNVELTFST